VIWPSPRAVDAVPAVESGKALNSEHVTPHTGARIPLYHTCLILLSVDKAIKFFLDKREGAWYT